MTLQAGQRLNFSNGWAIDIHNILDGHALYRRWPPGVTRQAWFRNLERRPTTEFLQLAEAAGGVVEEGIAELLPSPPVLSEDPCESN